MENDEIREWAKAFEKASGLFVKLIENKRFHVYIVLSPTGLQLFKIGGYSELSTVSTPDVSYLKKAIDTK